MASNSIIPLDSLPAGKQFHRFALDLRRVGMALLPLGHELIVNVETGRFIVLNWDERYLCADGVFNEAELPLMLTLIGSWPSFVQNEKLLVAVTAQPEEEIVQILDIAYDEALEPLRHLIESCRSQLHAFGIEIENMNDLGYKLSRYVARKGEREP